MLITGIRHAISSELDVRRSAHFVRYLIYYLEMFAYLGMIFPVLVVVDYFSIPKIKEETVTSKYYQVMDNLNKVEYYFYTGSYRFVSDIIFYENTNVSDNIILQRTPIFKTVTSVSHQSDKLVYTCKPTSIYGWPLIIACITFIFSIIFIIKTWKPFKKREHIKYDAMVNLGIINAILCIFIIFATLGHMLN